MCEGRPRPFQDEGGDFANALPALHTAACCCHHLRCAALKLAAPQKVAALAAQLPGNAGVEPPAFECIDEALAAAEVDGVAVQCLLLQLLTGLLGWPRAGVLP